ncbi:hypothetical protein ACCO45_004782 [Purpureocillium lilacinum]|uniref:Uncharacterized protein n=1 Tax=Purpureocillium lilacinum TaxID=33203 RepID=A0ACC4DTI1_PURLI
MLVWADVFVSFQLQPPLHRQALPGLTIAGCVVPDLPIQPLAKASSPNSKHGFLNPSRAGQLDKATLLNRTFAETLSCTRCGRKPQVQRLNNTGVD